MLKDQQRDAKTPRAWLAGVFLRRRCRSILNPRDGAERFRCTLRRGHKYKHQDGDLKWGYGDNWLEGN